MTQPNGKGIHEIRGRKTDFYEQLDYVEHEIARLQNECFDRMSPSSQEIMQKASIELMTEIVDYLNSALLYFLKSFFGTSFFCSLIIS